MSLVKQPCDRCPLPVEVTKGEVSHRIVVDSKVQNNKDEEGDICCPEGSYKWNEETAELRILRSSFLTRWSRLLTSIPARARTVSLLESFALRSPRSPRPVDGVAKCNEIAALEPPATMPQRALNVALAHKAVTRAQGKSVPRMGEKTSMITARSFMMSARNRYIFVSGTREVPK